MATKLRQRLYDMGSRNWRVDNLLISYNVLSSTRERCDGVLMHLMQVYLVTRYSEFDKDVLTHVQLKHAISLVHCCESDVASGTLAERREADYRMTGTSSFMQASVVIPIIGV